MSMPDALAALLTVRVALDVPLAREFDYLAPPPVAVGQRVWVPFGPRRLCGVVVALIDTPPDRPLKPVFQVLDTPDPLPADWLALVAFAADYYCHPLGQSLFTALPPALRQPRTIALPDIQHYRLSELGQQACAPSRRAHRQQILRECLAQERPSRDTIRALGSGMTRLLDDWCAQGWVEAFTPEPCATVLKQGPVPDLTAEQQDALQQLDGRDFAVTVLHGVTGSGKTEVYLRRIAQALAEGRQVLVLIPEINLTPQLEARFRARFPETPLALLHSHIAEQARAQAWLSAWQGRARLVLGTRLAVFTPLPDLGLIIVDEEHDHSFKQQDGLRYSARDLAIWRAKQSQVPILLGSATPSLETLANVEAGRYRRIRLLQRATGASLPTIHLVDVRHQPPRDGLSAPVLAALQGCLAAGETSLVYLNRRGYSPVLLCADCGWMAACSDCAARLVLHLSSRTLDCHHCAHQEPIPIACPSCGNPDLKPLGQGTQRVEETLAHHFPQARIARIDRDTVSRREAWAALYAQVHAREIDILVGTQMLAKGHDFPSLSLVAVLNADGGLYSADFRASERLFSELTQVAGRAGRAEIAGQVWVQTQLPEDPLYQALVRHDFDGYCQHLLDERRLIGLPPFSYQTLLRAEAEDRGAVLEFLSHVRQHLNMPRGVLCLGPVAAAMPRLAGRERAQLIFESEKRAALRHVLQDLQHQLPQLAKPFARQQVRYMLDIDPLEM